MKPIEISNWKISDVKRYFGMNGNAETLHGKLVKLYEILTEIEDKRKAKNG